MSPDSVTRTAGRVGGSGATRTYPASASGRYGSDMPSKLATARRRYVSWLDPAQQRGVRVLAWASLISLAGVTVTGLWQFATHESDPGWYGYRPDSNLAASPSGGVAELHGLFGASVAVVALFGGGWFAYRVLFDIPWPAAIGFVVAIAALISGSVMRFNLVKLSGRGYEGADRGYAQIFGGDLEFVVTDRFELGPMAIRLWTVGHLLAVPVLLGIVWLGLPVGDDSEA